MRMRFAMSAFYRGRMKNAATLGGAVRQTQAVTRSYGNPVLPADAGCYTATMPTTCRRQIFRRAVLVLAVVVLLPISYVAGVAALVAGASSGTIPPALFETRLPSLYIKPLQFYVAADLPGAESIEAIMEWSQRTAGRLRQR